MMLTNTRLSIDMTKDSLAGLPDIPLSLKLAGRALLNARKGRLVVALPDRRELVFDHGETGPHAKIRLLSFDVFSKALSEGDIGFGKSYMDGDWDTPDLTAVLEFFSENFEAAGGLALGQKIAHWLNRFRHAFNRNSKSGARRNIQAHYDLGNNFYEAWLDPSMTYSSALFKDVNMSLEDAQNAKYEAICEGLALKSGSRILEIGCGWGGFAAYAASNYDVHVTCLTLSKEQSDYALERIAREGLSEKVDIRLQDFRDHEGVYDGVASIEMFEAVGEQYWPVFFSKLQSFLKQGARASLQIITMRDDLFAHYRTRTDFIQRYIFPGGMMPSHTKLKQSFDGVDLETIGSRNFGEDYAETLKQWSERFNGQWTETIEPLGFDLRFRRMWNFYLSYCEAGFKTGRVNVCQYYLVKM